MTRIKIDGRAATHYGTRDIEDVFGSKYKGENGKNILSYTFSFDDLPVATLDEAALTIPANSFIVSATLRVLEALDGTTPTLTLGLQQKDGTEIDNDGIDVAIAESAVDTVGETVLCDGALVAGLAGIGAARGQLVATTGGTVTAGKFSLEIEYKELLQRA